MAKFTLIQTCYGCGDTLSKRNIGDMEAAEYARDIKGLGAQIGRVETKEKRVVLYDGLCPECLLEIFPQPNNTSTNTREI